MTGLRHEGGDRWSMEQAVTGWSDRKPGMKLVIARRVIVAPGDPTDRLREALRQRRRK